MLRLLVLILLLANGAYFAWSKGLLEPYGLAPASQSEPQRLAQQISPEAIRILSTAGTASTLTAVVHPAALASPAECLQVGLFNEEQTVVLRERLQSVLPAGSWVLESAVEPASWIVYMGKYSGADALERKRGELRKLRVAFAPLNNPALEPGLSLGTFTLQADANAELERIAKRGVRTAKVVQAQLEVRGQKLRLPAVGTDLRPQLDALKPQLAGKSLQACR